MAMFSKSIVSKTPWLSQLHCALTIIPTLKLWQLYLMIHLNKDRREKSCRGPHLKLCNNCLQEHIVLSPLSLVEETSAARLDDQWLSTEVAFKFETLNLKQYYTSNGFKQGKERGQPEIRTWGSRCNRGFQSVQDALTSLIISFSRMS